MLLMELLLRREFSCCLWNSCYVGDSRVAYGIFLLRRELSSCVSYRDTYLNPGDETVVTSSSFCLTVHKSTCVVPDANGPSFVAECPHISLPRQHDRRLRDLPRHSLVSEFLHPVFPIRKSLQREFREQ